ncbi:ATP-dependent Clp protease ATP-binding subunit CLPT2, chloroplastic-like [Cornus florida]|uniref:ATP-dependent Clp protease ATP-binding subunit CLPT2, chloroplastic-like n=1 Tax=Cornus florida TaxID=4283 RepID=UPI00289A1491|nr:ATP-dependent Clp protease ATP-binding subunit CLPT2, chloroplastic-like [Cornus florida]
MAATTTTTLSLSKTTQTRALQSDCTPLKPSFTSLSPSPWLGTAKLSLQSSNLRTQMPICRPITAKVLFSLPITKPERVSTIEEVPKWSSKAIKSYAMAELEARKLKYSTTGTEALLMGILIEGTNLASKFLRANGITLFKVREEAIKLLGKADMYFFSPEHPPLTEAAQRALDWAVDEKLKSGEGGEITTTHLLLGVWSEKESPGHKIMSSFGFNDEKAKELKSLISEAGFVED